MAKDSKVSWLEDDICVCEICGAHASSPKKIKHFKTHQVGEPEKSRRTLKITKKHLLIGCILGVGLALIKWMMPRYTEIGMQFSEPLPDGDYVVGSSGDSERIKIKHGKTYHVT